MSDRPFLRSDEYRWQVDPRNPKKPVRGASLQNFKKFLTAKRQNPNMPYGANDKPFIAGGKFSTKIPKLAHAHITHDISIVYRVVGNTIYLYGFYSHDDLGTGSPVNRNKQDSMATKFSQMNFSE